MLFIKKPEGSGPGDLSEASQPPMTQPASAKSPGGSTQTVVDAGLTITGNLLSLGDVQVDGKICGDIQCANLVVGKDGTITGDIVAEQAVVRGRVKGTI
jgi:cytoskeletal protein CcmA (bactofilin family)